MIGPFGISNILNNTGKRIATLDTGTITTYSLYITLGLLTLLFIIFTPLFLDASLINEMRLIIIYLYSLLIVLW